MPALRFSIIFSLSLLLLTPLFIPTFSISQVQPAVESTYRGDINEDGQVNIFDLLKILKLLSSEPESDRQRQIANVDKSADGKVNIFDLLALLRLLGGGEPEEIFWGPAISGLSSLSAAVGDTVGINVINFDESISAADVKAYLDSTEASILEFSLDSISIVIPEGFTGGDVWLTVASDTTNSKYLNLQIKQQVQAADGGVVGHPDGTSVDIPAGALQADAVITVEVPTEAQLKAMDISTDTATTIVLFGPSGTSFAGPVTVALPWPNSATEADSLGAQYFDENEGAWKAIGTVGSDSGQRLVYVQTNRLAAFKSVKTRIVKVRLLTTSSWTTFNLVSGGVMSLHHLVSASEEATAAELRGDTIYLSQSTEQSELGEIVEIVVDMSFNVPELSKDLEFEIGRSRSGSTWAHVALANYLGAETNNRENFWWGGFKEYGQPNSKTVRISTAELFSQTPARVPTTVDPTTLDQKVLFLYQGWFMCPGDGSDQDSWIHWFQPGNKCAAYNIKIDFWPDMSELSPEERFTTEMTLPDGSPAEVYSNYIRKTVVRHFKWMEDYDLDGVFIQRCVLGGYSAPLTFCERNKVLQNVRAGAEAHGRVFAIEYWLTCLMGCPVGECTDKTVEYFKKDWMFLVDELKITESPNYLHHKGKPLLAFIGPGDWEDPLTPAQYDSIVNWLQVEADPKYQATVQGSALPSDWRTLEPDTEPVGLYMNFQALDVISPWFIKYTYEQVDCYKDRYFLPDIPEAAAAGVDYMPVIFPGFSVFNQNLQRIDYKLNVVPRLGGRFFWRQAYNAISAGANMIYIATFDEIDEGTAMYKVAPTSANFPVETTLLPLDADGYVVPSDWYLQLAREVGKMLRGEIPLSPEMPLALPAYDPNLDTKVIPEIAMVSIPGGIFEMGSENGDSIEEPVHTVTVSSFQISQYEITNAQYAAYLNTALEESDELSWITATTSEVRGGLFEGNMAYINLAGSYDSDNRCWISFDGSSFNVEPGKEDWPVVYVTWYGARGYAMKYGFDLPTEAEWEYACRGGQQYEYGTDDGTISSAKANYGTNIGYPADAGSYPVNPFGLYDMSGNVSEWCSDWYGSYSTESQSDPQGPDTGSKRVMRGGDWNSSDDQCRSAFRNSRPPQNTTYGYTAGFRVVKRP